jgi:hypothetical protein
MQHCLQLRASAEPRIDGLNCAPLCTARDLGGIPQGRRSRYAGRQLELDRGLDRKLARLGAFEDAIDIGRRGRKLSGGPIALGLDVPLQLQQRIDE